MTQAVFKCPPLKVLKEWIDYNGHLNMAYYHVLFDKSLDAAFDEIGIGVDYVERHGGSCFTLETHVNYLQELVLDDPVQVTIQLLDWDHKRIHYFEEMYHAKEGYLAATSEQLAMHVDMKSRKTAAFPDSVQAVLKQWYDAHSQLGVPAYSGRKIGIVRK